MWSKWEPLNGDTRCSCTARAFWILFAAVIVLASNVDAQTIAGVYTGTYTCQPRDLRLTVTITEISDGAVKALFQGSTGSTTAAFSMSGRFAAASRSLELTPDQWVSPRPPKGWVMSPLHGKFDQTEARLTGTSTAHPSCSAFDLTKDVRRSARYQPPQPRPAPRTAVQPQPTAATRTPTARAPEPVGRPPSSPHPAPSQPSPSSPADVNGAWFIGARGVGGTRLLLKTDGTNLTGMLWQREETDGYPIHDGQVHGNELSFKVTVQVPNDGRSGRHPVTNSYSGKLTSDKLDLTWTSGVDAKVVRPQNFSRCDSSGPNACHLGKKIG